MGFSFTGKGSWFGGPRDGMDSGKMAGGNTTKLPAVAVRLPGKSWRDSRKYLNHYVRVTAPNGKTAVYRIGDLGPNESTGRNVDITYSGLKRLGYTEQDFPTDAQFKVEYVGKSPGARTQTRSGPVKPTGAVTGGSDLQAQARRQAAAQWLLSPSKSVADLQNQVAQAEASVPVTQQQPTTVKPASQQPAAAPASGHGAGDLKELFWQGQGGTNVKNGQHVPQGFVSGHQDHVHVASGPQQVLRIARKAQQMGLHVGENPQYGGVAPVHATNSYHYRNQAIDVSGDPVKMRRFAAWVARTYGVKV